MIKNCEQCNKEFEAKRDTAKYCSTKCRKLAFLKKDITVPENDKGRVSVPKTTVPKVSVPLSFNDIYSPDYDLSEEGFIRRNKNWMDFSERFRENIKTDIKRIRKRIINGIKEAKKDRKHTLINPLLNTTLAPKT